MFNESDHTWMNQAILLARNGLYTTRENPRVGCVLVKNGEKIAEGWHEFPGGPHAEVKALAIAKENAKGATCYVSLSPCTHYGKTPPCYDALIKAGITRIVAATADPNPRVQPLNIEYGLCETEAKALNPGFFMRMQQQRPFIRLKTGMSLDGRTAMANGESQWITGAASRALVQKLRAQSCVILTSINTVLSDNPSLNVRDINILSQPIRVILDTHLRIPLDAKLFAVPGAVWIYTQNNHSEKIALLNNKGAQVFVMPLDLHEVVKHLASQHVNEVLVESGSILNGAFLQAGLVDEWHIFVAPKIMGDEARGLCTLPGVSALSQAINLDITEHFQVGDDYYYIAKVKK